MARRFGAVLALTLASVLAMADITGGAWAATTGTTTTAAKKKVKTVVHKPVPRPTVPDLKKAGDATTVPLGSPTASKKALAVPLAGPARVVQTRPVSFAGHSGAASGHGFGTVVAHVVQDTPHLQLKP